MYIHYVCVCVCVSRSVEQLYKYVYFNEMNLAVKSYLSSVRRSVSPAQLITPDAMRLIIELNTEYDE